jgi:hypothetical protein
MSTADEYDVMSDKEGWIESWPRTTQGVITATKQACNRSVNHGPHEVQRDGNTIARYENGRRHGLPPGGIASLLDAKAGGDDQLVGGRPPQRATGVTVKITPESPAARRAARKRAMAELPDAEDPLSDADRERLERLFDPTGGE